MWLVGAKIAITFFFIVFLSIEGNTKWPITILLTTVGIYVLFIHFNNLLKIFWPTPIISKWSEIPWLF
jgi:hypothetical protein